MEFKIDMSKVVKIVVAKDENSFIEYSIDNGTIVDVSILGKETTIEEKVENLKQTNEDVKRISKLIEFDKAGILNKMAKTGDSLFKTIKDTVVNEPIEGNVIKKVKEVTDSINKNTLTEGVKDAAKIMKLDNKMDEFARANRDKIAEKVFDSEEKYEKNLAIDEIMQSTIDKLSKTSDKMKRIDGLKKMITEINTKNKE